MKIFKIATALFLLISFLSCSSVQPEGQAYVEPDYTSQDVRNEEIKRIKEMLQEKSVQAYWRSLILGDKEVIQTCEDQLVKTFNEAVEKQDYFKARTILLTLKNCSSKAVTSLSKNISEIEFLYNQKFQLNTDNTSDKTKKVSQFIDGTVTVWVDKGIKVENGMGYADRVIGSGFFISKDGYIVTNHHVIADLVNPKYEGYSRLYVKLARDNETRIPAKVVGWDSEIDLAVLKSEIEAPYVFALGSSKGLETGDKIFCIGSPVGLERTLTSGIVSATDRMLFSAGPVMQIDAAVNSGNSGGPCIDENGNVQAIVFAGMLQYEGLNFAIPVEYLKAELSALLSGGKFNHGWVNAYGRTKKNGLSAEGLEIQYVMPGGSAYRAGLREGFVITEADGVKVTCLEEMQRVLIANVADSVIKVKYLNDSGNTEECLVYLSVRPSNPGYVFYKNDIIASSFAAIYGFKLKSISNYGKKYQIETVFRGSIADESGFSDNDPVEFRNINFNEDNTLIYSEVYAKNRKKGYLDIGMALAAPLDSPYYF